VSKKTPCKYLTKFRKIFYEKIKPLKPETIDIASIIADYHGSDSR